MPSRAKWIDSHAHLDHEYPFSTDEYLTNARASGIAALVTIGTHPHSLPRLRALAEEHADVYFTVGVHPHEAKDLDAGAEKIMDEFRLHPKCVAVGEIGLDYYYDHSPREIQRAAFERQLELARAWSKPVVIHARDAETDLLERLTDYAKKHACARGPGVIHCFSGTQGFARACLALGFYLSFSGILTFKKADVLRAIAAETPLDRILLETDAPFLAPVPYRGKPNQSAYLIETAKIMARLKGLTLDDLSSATVANSRRFFGLEAVVNVRSL